MVRKLSHCGIFTNGTGLYTKGTGHFTTGTVLLTNWTKLGVRKKTGMRLAILGDFCDRTVSGFTPPPREGVNVRIVRVNITLSELIIKVQVQIDPWGKLC